MFKINYRYSFCLVLLLINFSLVFSQEKQISAIKEKLKEKNINDSTKIKLLGDLGWYFSSFASDSAFKYSNLALNLSKKTNNTKGVAQSYNDIGIIHYRISQFDSSLVYYRKSLLIRKKQNDSLGIASIYNKMGISYNQLFKLDSAIYYTLESIKIYKEKKQLKMVSLNLNNLANLYKDTKQHQKALQTHKKSLKIKEQLNDSIGYVYSYNGLADIYNNYNKIDSAKFYYKKAIPITEKLNLESELSTIQNNLATIYEKEGKTKEAQKLFESSLKIREKLNDTYGIISSLINLASININYKNFKTAENQFLKALSLSKKTNAKEQLIYIYKGLVSVKGNLNEPDSLNIYFKKYEKIKDSLYNNTVISEVTEIEAKYKTAEKEKEIAQQKEQLLKQELSIKNRNLYAILLGAALLILGIISFAVYKRNQFKRKQLQKEIDLKDALSVIKTQNTLQEQRLRISRDLHDNIGSQLTFIISSLDNLKFISKDVSDALKNKITSISGFTSETIHQLRDTIWAMNKSEISMEDLHTRILSFVEKAKIATHGIEFEINQNVTKEISLSSLKGMNIFRVVQEAINNSIKYAEASKITINIDETANEISIVVTDNGNGFDIKTVELGNGLSNMESRMSEVDGKVSITSKLGDGTNIKIIL